MNAMKSMVAALLACCAPALAAEVGPEAVLPASPGPAHDPCAAFGDGRYLVVWQSGRAASGDVYACRLDGAGKALDARPLAVSTAGECQERPRAAWGQDAWLVVWADLRNDKDYDVYAARVSGDGKLLDAEGVLLAGGEHNQCAPDAAWNGEQWLVIWRAWQGDRYAVRGARVAADGKVLDPEGLKITDGPGGARGAAEPHVVAVGGKWLVGWGTRALQPVGGGGGGQAGFFTNAVSGDGQAGPAACAAKNQGMDNVMCPTTLASDGKAGCLASWSNRSQGGRSGTQHGMPYGALRVDGDGKLLGTVELGGREVGVAQPSAAWDGKGYVVAFYWGYVRHRDHGGGFSRVVATHLVSAEGGYEGKVEVASAIGADEGASPPYAPAACGDGQGNCLVVYEKHPARAGDPILIAGRLIRR